MSWRKCLALAIIDLAFTTRPDRTHCVNIINIVMTFQSMLIPSLCEIDSRRRFEIRGIAAPWPGCCYLDVSWDWVLVILAGDVSPCALVVQRDRELCSL
jgi:hypothetical protein